jgi:branched-chain amino acid transport system permease protein
VTVDGAPHASARRRRVLRNLTDPIFLGSLALIVVMPILAGGSSTSFFALSLVFASIYITLALAWDFSSGMTGYLNFGLPFFFGIGALTAGYLSWHGDRTVPVLLLFAFGTGLLGGFLFSIPTLRLRGPYFSLLSFLLPLIGSDFVLAYWVPLGWPTEGFYGLPFLSSTPGGELILLSVVNAVVLVGFFVLRSSHFGLILRGIRDDEDALASQGIPTFPYKVVAFTLSSGVVAFSGAAYAMVNTFSGVDTFGFDFILFPILIVLLGGTGELVGSVAAGYVVILVYQYFFPIFSDLTLIFFALAAILLVLFVPHGIVRPLRSFIRFMRTEEPT